MYTLYIITDPSYYNEVKYVETTEDFIERKYEILSKENIGESLKKWIESLERRDFKPEFSVLEEIEESKEGERYRYWIGYYKKEGNELLNIRYGNKKHGMNLKRG